MSTRVDLPSGPIPALGCTNAPALSSSGAPALSSPNTSTPPPPPTRAVFEVRGEFDVAAVIAGARHFCAENGADALFAAHVATAASELANNLWLHAEGGGLLSLTALWRGGQFGVELLSEDDGPGISDPALAMTEGWSSAGGLGFGLPGVRRLMDEFELDSAPGIGTRVTARKWTTHHP